MQLLPASKKWLKGRLNNRPPVKRHAKEPPSNRRHNKPPARKPSRIELLGNRLPEKQHAKKSPNNKLLVRPLDEKLLSRLFNKGRFNGRLPSD